MKPAQTSRLTVELKCLVVASMLLAGLVPATPAHAVRHKMERMAGWHETLIVMNELHPRAALLTYVEDRASHTDQYMLVRLLPHLEKAGSLEGPSQAGNLLVEDFPGGVDASFELGDVRIDVEFFPLPVGRETSAQDGAAVYTVKTTPPTPVVLQCGGGDACSPFIDPTGSCTKRVSKAGRRRWKSTALARFSLRRSSRTRLASRVPAI